MSTERQVQALRSQMAAELDRIQQLAERRNLLLHLAVDNPRPCVARALRCNRQLADAARRAARLARAQLTALEGLGGVAGRCPPSAVMSRDGGGNGRC